VRGGELALDSGVTFANVRPLAEVQECALLCVPGGFGTATAMEDPLYLEALRRLGSRRATSLPCAPDRCCSVRRPAAR